MKKKDYQDKPVKIYLALYQHKILATSFNKEVLNEYMITNRRLKSNEYTIYSECITHACYYMRYEDQILEEFNHHYITHRDYQMMLKDFNGLDDEIDSLVNKLKYMTFLCNRSKIDKNEIDDFIKVMKHLKKYTKKDKIYTKLEENHYMNHPVFGCKINEYLDLIKRYEEMKYYNDLYKRSLVEE